jgi:hypothetical protein
LGKITIKHGPAKRLGMESGMTMVYKAQDPASRATRRRVRGDPGTTAGRARLDCAAYLTTQRDATTLAAVFGGDHSSP